MDNSGRCGSTSAENDISFDVFFEDDEDFMKICNDSPHQETKSSKSHKIDDDPSKHSVSSFSNESTNIVTTKTLLNFSLKNTIDAAKCAKKEYKSGNGFWALTSPCTSGDSTGMLSNKELLNFNSNNVPFLAECIEKNVDDPWELSSPCTTVEPLGNLLSQSTKTMASLRKDLEFETLQLKSPVPNNSMWLAKISTNYSSHKARKRKFPGPAGLLPDLPSRSPLVPKQHDYSLELNTIENANDQGLFYSQSSGDDFLSAPWSNMMKDLTSGNLALLTKFNIKRIRKQAAKKKLPKCVEVPFFCVLLKSFVLKDSEVITLFKDETGEISGKIHQEVIDKYRDSMKVGSVIVLKKAVFLLDQLGIKLANIVRIYDPNGNKICVNDWNDAVSWEGTDHLSSRPPKPTNGNNCNEDKPQDYIDDFMEESLFEDDLNDIVSTLDENSFIV